MASVFVSYAREDAAKAHAIARALERASFNVWFDQRMHSGSEYSREIEQALKDAAAVVVLWSRSSVDSAWVRDEAVEGRDSGRLVPALLDDVRPPIGFRQFQATDLSRWSGRGKPKQIDDVIAAVAAKAGTSREEVAPAAAPTTAPKWKRPFALAAAALALVVVAAVVLWLLRPTHRPPTSPTVAVLPFTADASDADARKLAAATRDGVAHTLSNGAFSVSTLDAAPQDNRASADYVISGQVTATPDKVVTTVRMEETAHNFVVFSHQFDATRAEAWDMPERIGAQVASQLSWTAPLIAMDKRHPSDPAVLKALLQSGIAGLGGDVGELSDYEASRRIAVQAPNSPLALDQLAFNTAFALDQIPRDQRPQALLTARRAMERTVELAPEFGSGRVPWCFLHSEVRRAECEDRLREGIRADPDDPFVNFFLAFLVLNPVGRNAEAAQLAGLSLAQDQYMPYKIGLMLRTLEATAQTTKADNLYRQTVRWWPANPIIFAFRQTGMVQRGDFEAARRFGDEVGGDFKANPTLVAISSKSLPAIRSACSRATDLNGIMCMLALAKFGDLDGAFTLAERLYPSRLGRTPAEQERIWLDNPAAPVAFLTGAGAAALRKDTRYIALAQRVGLLDYWRSGRRPDFCRGRGEPICSKF
jgi:adenylate cyclase